MAQRSPPRSPPRHVPDAAPLTSNPFAALKASRPDAAEGDAGTPPPAPAAPPPSPRPAKPAPAWRVRKTRKGGWPLRVERRGGGRSVTVLEGVEGDAAALLAMLKKRLGTGGAVIEGGLEIQGDHTQVIGALLDETR